MENNNFDTNNADNDIYTFSVDETWWLTEETVTPAIQLIQKINEFICSVLNKDRIIEDGIYGNTIRTTAENIKEYIFDNEKVTYGEEQEEMLQAILDMLNDLDEDILDSFSTEDLFGEKDIAEYMKRRKQGKFNYDEWKAFEEGAEEVYFEKGYIGSPFYILKERVLFLSEVLRALSNEFAEEYTINIAIEDLKDYRDKLDKLIESELAKIFSIKLSAILKTVKMSQSELANAIGVSRQTINEYCSGKSKPTLDKIIAIAVALNTSIDYLLRPGFEMIDLEESHMQMNYGLDIKSVSKLKKLKDNKEIMNTLNLLLSQCGEKNDEFDILSKLAHYLTPDYSTYAIDSKEWDSLVEYIKNTDNIEDIKHYVKCLDSEVKQQLPDSHVTLKELDDTLINAKKKIFDRYLKSLDK